MTPEKWLVAFLLLTFWFSGFLAGIALMAHKARKEAREFWTLMITNQHRHRQQDNSNRAERPLRLYDRENR